MEPKDKVEKDDKDISLLDLAESHEPGPVLKERPPNLSFTTFHSDEGQFFYGNPPLPRNSFTRQKKLAELKSLALGLTDIPRSSVPGAQSSRQYFEYSSPDGEQGYGEEDLEVSHRSGFGAESNMESEDTWPSKSKDNDGDSINNHDKEEEYFDFLYSKEADMSGRKHDLIVLANALRQMGHSDHADRIVKIALPPLAIAAIIAAVLGGAGLSYNEYDKSDVDEDMISKLAGSAGAFAAAMDKLWSIGGSDVDAAKVEMMMLQAAKDSSLDLSPLYQEIARVLSGQDLSLDAHWGWFGGNDKGDFSDHFPNLQSDMVTRFKGKEISQEGIKSLLEEDFEAWYAWGHEPVFSAASSELQNYVDAWNELVKFDAAIKYMVKSTTTQSAATKSSDEPESNPFSDSRRIPPTKSREVSSNDEPEFDPFSDSRRLR